MSVFLYFYPSIVPGRSKNGGTKAQQSVVCGAIIDKTTYICYHYTDGSSLIFLVILFCILLSGRHFWFLESNNAQNN